MSDLHYRPNDHFAASILPGELDRVMGGGTNPKTGGWDGKLWGYEVNRHYRPLPDNMNDFKAMVQRDCPGRGFSVSEFRWSTFDAQGNQIGKTDEWKPIDEVCNRR